MTTFNPAIVYPEALTVEFVHKGKTMTSLAFDPSKVNEDSIAEMDALIESKDIKRSEYPSVPGMTDELFVHYLAAEADHPGDADRLRLMTDMVAINVAHGATNETNGNTELFTWLRSEFHAKKGRESQLNDGQLENLVSGVSDEDAANTSFDWVGIMERMEDSLTDDIEEQEGTTSVRVERHTANSMKANAIHFATEHYDDTIEDASFDIQEADEKSKRGIAIILFTLSQTWDDDTWNAIPNLDVTEKEAKEKKLNVLLPRWSYKDGNRNRVSDWFEIVITQGKKGSALVKYIDDLRAASTDVVKTEKQQEYASWGALKRDGELATAETRLRNLVTRFKRVVRLKRTIDLCNEISNVQAGLITDVDQEGNELGVSRQVACIFLNKINNKGNTIAVEAMLPATFLRLDPATIVKEGKGYDELIKTKDREQKEGDKDFKVPTSPEKFLSAVNQIGHYVEEGIMVTAFQKYFAAAGEPEQLTIAQDYESIYEKMASIYMFMKPTLEKLRAAEKVKATANKPAPKVVAAAKK